MKQDKTPWAGLHWNRASNSRTS